MSHLSQKRFPTKYFPNPEDLLGESLPFLWKGGNALIQFAAECPEVYELALAEDRLVINSLPDNLDVVKSLKAAHPKQEIVRGLDGHLTTADNLQYQKEIAEFRDKVAKKILS